MNTTLRENEHERTDEHRLNERKTTLKPSKDPLEELSKLIKKVKIKASLQPELISKTAEEQLTREH